MTFKQAVNSCFRNYFKFSGRASRPEFWWFVLFLVIISTIIQTYINTGVDNVKFMFGLYFNLSTEAHWLENTFTLVTFIPFIAAISRRLHDIGQPGYIAFVWLGFLTLTIASFWVLPWLFGFVGMIFLIIAAIYFLTKKSQPGPNKYGPNPHEVHT